MGSIIRVVAVVSLAVIGVGHYRTVLKQYDEPVSVVGFATMASQPIAAK